MTFLEFGINAVERGLVPDSITRRAMRNLCGERLKDLSYDSEGRVALGQARFIESMRSAPIAPVPKKANEQHYELPPEFFVEVLGQHRKYSCCLWPDGPALLRDAEENALRATCEHAQIADGQQILELGCGWGSLSLWMARRFPNSHVTAVSNSTPQRLFIEEQAKREGITNLNVITADMNSFAPPDSDGQPAKFDRVVSVEMFEHMRNYALLLSRIASWLKPDGLLLVHIFCHRTLIYPFETDGAANWMGRYFFTGGIMPNENILRNFSDDLKVIRQWTWDGRHYQRTADAWLKQLDDRRAVVMPILNGVYGPVESKRWLHRWRMFFMAVSELFGYANGQEWMVLHSLLQRAGR